MSARAFGVAAALALAAQGALAAVDPDFHAKGFQRNRELASELSFEQVDPLSGNLMLNLPMLSLPGNAGFDLVIRPVYNIKIYSSYLQTSHLVGENGPAGLGFTLHFGRVHNFNGNTPGPVIELPDGSMHPSFVHRASNDFSRFMTKEYWTYDRFGGPNGVPLLRMPNGMRYTFGEDTTLDGPLYATEIADRFGNRLRIHYSPTRKGEVQSVDQDLRTGPNTYQTRTVQFTYVTFDAHRALSTVISDLGTWTFVQEEMPADVGTQVVLSELRPPNNVMPPWKFAYYPRTHADAPFLLQRLDTPNGGVITYEYQREDFYRGSTVTYAPVLKKRTVSGPDIAGGVWTYTFVSPGPFDPITATIDAPCRQTKYVSNPISEEQEGDQSWLIGTLASREIRTAGGGSRMELATFGWQRSIAISTNPYGTNQPTYTALLQSRRVERDGLTLDTINTYEDDDYNGGISRNFHDYGQPTHVREQGSVERDTDLVYSYPPGGDPGFGTYLVGLLENEKVRVGTEMFENSYAYQNGFMTDETIYGVHREFKPTQGGNVAKVIDDSSHTKDFEYQWGTTSRIKTQGYDITREVNRSGTIHKETRRQFETIFGYDGLGRLRSTDHPEGHTTFIDYTADGRSMKQRRGSSFLETTLDRLGRPTATVDAVGVKTDTNYDACGRIVYSSYPFAATNRGTTFGYDALDRMTSRKNPDDSDATFAYAPGPAGKRKVTITDELDRPTTQLWETFGHPDDARLVSVEDAGSGSGGARQTTTYSYNAVGSLTRVDSPLGGDRVWVYNDKNQLVSEDHPESDEVTYTYQVDGLPKDRTDAAGTTKFSFDGNHRLTGVDRPGAAADSTTGYDASDNRLQLTRGPVVSAFRNYDGNNRLGEREDTIGGRKLITKYSYDENDNVSVITYPSSARVAYTYDNQNRIRTVADGPGPGASLYADDVTWHLSGGLESYEAGNGTFHKIDYDEDRYFIDAAHSRDGTTELTRSNYGHDSVGNVTSLQESWLGTPPVSLTYDDVDRLKTFGPSGAPFRSDYAYDTLGNRTERKIGVPLTTFTYQQSTNRLLEQNQSGAITSFHYDGNGNTARIVPPAPAPEEIYTYDPDNMLATVTGTAASASYLYDGDQLRKRKITGGQTTLFVHGPGNQVLGEYGPSGTAFVPNREYVYAGTRPIAVVKPAFLTVSPELVAFAEVKGSPATSGPRTVSIQAGTAVANWQAEPREPWISVNPPSGNTPGTLSVTVNHAGLEIGVHTGTITVTSTNALGSPRIITVLLAVTAEEGLAVLPRPIRFEATEGDTSTPSQPMYVMRAGSAVPARWDALVSPTSPWVSISATQGETPSTVDVTVDPTGRRRGTHRGFITVTADLSGSPKVVPVELVVRPGPGTLCDPAAWYCERFDDMELGPIDGQHDWDAIGGEVAFDPRGEGKVLLLDAPSVGDGTINGFVDVVDHPIGGNQISVQLMVEDVPEEARQVAKVEFQTIPAVAWGKTTRTYGAVRFGSKIYLQFGPNIWKVLVDRVENGRWYEVRVVYQGNQIFAYVDGQQRAVLTNPLAPTYPTQRFVFTGWDFPGRGHIDLLQAREAESGLVVDPQPVRFSSSNSIGLPKPDLARRQEAPAQALMARRRPADLMKRASSGFETNRGQAPAEARYVARGHGYDVMVTDDALVVAPAGTSDVTPVRIRFENARPGLLEPLEPLSGPVHYLRGNDPSQWVKGVQRHGRIRHANIYPGIDLEVYLRDQLVEYDLVVAPGADPAQIRIAFEGARELRLEEDGQLVAETAWGAIRQRPPRIYQPGDESPVSGGYVLDGSRHAAFSVGEYDTSRVLVLDPILAYSTYLGGGSPEFGHGQEFISDVEVDADGAVYVTGSTSSLAFATETPIRIGPPPGPDSPVDIFVAKINPAGSAIEWLTYIGGAESEFGSDLVVDGTGRVSLVGQTHSPDFPTAPPGGVIDPTYGGEGDVVVLRLNAGGDALEFSTYLGGSLNDDGWAIALDTFNGAVVGGATLSADFPVHRPLRQQDQHHNPGNHDGWVTWIRPDGTSLRHSTFLGGGGEDFVASLVTKEVEPTGTVPPDFIKTHVFIGGITSSTDFHTTPGVVGPTHQGSMEGFATRLRINQAGMQNNLVFRYSTYINGPGWDLVNSIAVDANLVAHLAFEKQVVGVGQTQNIIGLEADATSIVYERTLGAAGPIRKIAVSPGGELAVAGDAQFPCDDHCFPYVLPVFRRETPGISAYVAAFSPLASSILFATELGCNQQQEYAQGLGVTVVDGATYAVGITSCLDFPLANALQPFHAGGQLDGFVAHLIHPAPEGIEFTSATYVTPESGDGPVPPEVVISLRRSGSLSEQASVTFRTSDGTATAGTDYFPAVNVVTFAIDQSEATTRVRLIDDVIAEPTETVLLSLTDPVGGELGPLSAATLSIEDDDGLTRTVRIRDRVLPVGPAWGIEEEIPWLSFSATSGTGPSTVTANADPSGLPPGTYSDFFVVTGDTGDSPQIVEAILKVLP